MAKDRFNTRASWDSSFKYSGQMMPLSPKLTNTPPKKRMTDNVLNKITSFYKNSIDVMNDWEAGFVKSIIDKGFELSPKQKETFKNIWLKIDKKNDRRREENRD